MSAPIFLFENQIFRNGNASMQTHGVLKRMATYLEYPRFYTVHGSKFFDTLLLK